MRRASILLETAFFCATTLLSAATGKHLPQSTLYPRLIRLEHAPGALQGSLLAKTSNRLFRSVDEGRTFTFLTTVPTVSLEHGNPTPAVNAPDKERCCSTIYELPRKDWPFQGRNASLLGVILLRQHTCHRDFHEHRPGRPLDVSLDPNEIRRRSPRSLGTSLFPR